MMIIFIEKKLPGIILILIGVIFSMILFFQLRWQPGFDGLKLAAKYGKMVTGIEDRYETSDLTAFLVSDIIRQQYRNDVEIFDIAQGGVVKRIHVGHEIQKEAVGYLEGINGMYVKANAFPQKGYIIKIPLTPTAVIRNQWLNDYGISSVGEFFILFPDEGAPYLLVLDEKSRPLFFNFAGDTGTLLKLLELKL